MEPIIKNKPGEEKEISGSPAVENDKEIIIEETGSKRRKVIAIVCFVIAGILLLYIIFRPHLQKRTLQSDIRKLKIKPTEKSFSENKEEDPV